MKNKENIQFLADILSKEGLTKISYESKGVKIKLEKVEKIISANNAEVVKGNSGAITNSNNNAESINAPLVGVFYEAPKPGADNFVEKGTTVEVGQVIGLIEAMKVMNEVIAEEKVTIEEILVKDGDLIEYGQPLYKIKR